MCIRDRCEIYYARPDKDMEMDTYSCCSSDMLRFRTSKDPPSFRYLVKVTIKCYCIRECLRLTDMKEHSIQALAKQHQGSWSAMYNNDQSKNSKSQLLELTHAEWKHFVCHMIWCPLEPHYGNNIQLQLQYHMSDSTWTYIITPSSLRNRYDPGDKNSTSNASSLQ